MATLGTLGSPWSAWPGTVADPTLKEVKNAIEQSNRLFEEFKRTNDERLKRSSKGRASSIRSSPRSSRS
jgi:hypothetical protein